MIDLQSYQAQTAKTAIYPRENYTQILSYLALGLAGEAGEFANIAKKTLRDGKFDTSGMRAELGDVLWYALALAHEMGWDIEQIIRDNFRKLEGRNERGTIGGKGEDR